MIRDYVAKKWMDKLMERGHFKEEELSELDHTDIEKILETIDRKIKAIEAEETKVAQELREKQQKASNP